MTEQPIEQPPTRRVYFGALDRQHLAARQIPGGPDLQTLEISRRQKLAMTLTQRAEDVAAGVKTLRAFDATGNTGAAVEHLRVAVADLDRAYQLLAEDVLQSLGRHQERRTGREIIDEVAAARGIPTVPAFHDDADAARAGVLPAASAAAEAPKPGPR